MSDYNTDKEIMIETASFIAEFVGYTNTWYVGDAAKSDRIVANKYKITEIVD